MGEVLSAKAENAKTRLGGLALKKLSDALALVENFTAAVAGLTVFVLMLIAIANIALRKLSDLLLWLAPQSKPDWIAPIFGYIDIVELAMVLFAVFCISYTQRQGGHVRMELLLNRFSGRLLWFLEVLTTLIAFVIIVVLMRYSINFAMDALEIGDSTIDAELSTWPAKMIIPLAFVILLARLSLQLWGYTRLLIDPDVEPIGVPALENVEQQARHEIEGAGITNGSGVGAR